MAFRLAFVPVVVAVVLVGTWVTGGLITDDFEYSVALNTAFFAVVGAAALILSLRRRDLLWPVLGTYLVSSALVGGFLAYGTFVDKTVDEAVAQGPVGAAGAFRSLAHETTGTARVVRDELQLIDLATDPGPDLRVYLTEQRYRGGDPGAHVDVGPLKGNRGTQRYALGVDARAYASVVIWCRAFSVAFGVADISRRD